MISGRAKRFGKPEEVDVFNTKATEFVPAPDTYFQGESGKYSATYISKGFTFNRSPRVMFNEVTDKSHLVGFASSPFNTSINKSVSAGYDFTKRFDDSKQKEFENIGPGSYSVDD